MKLGSWYDSSANISIELYTVVDWLSKKAILNQHGIMNIVEFQDVVVIINLRNRNWYQYVTLLWKNELSKWDAWINK